MTILIDVIAMFAWCVIIVILSIVAWGRGL